MDETINALYCTDDFWARRHSQLSNKPRLLPAHQAAAAAAAAAAAVTHRPARATK
jgi:hypothetical protein